MLKIHFYLVSTSVCSGLWNTSIFGQKLPIRTTHYTFLESRHPEVTKNLYHVLSTRRSQIHTLLGSSPWSILRAAWIWNFDKIVLTVFMTKTAVKKNHSSFMCTNIKVLYQNQEEQRWQGRGEVVRVWSDWRLIWHRLKYFTENER